MAKPFSPSCERNREPILAVLRDTLPAGARVLEIGSGTGQHAVYFAARLPGVTWQTSDVPQNHAGIDAWLMEAGLPNVLPPLALDVAADPWPTGPYDAVFSANTCHIMSWSEVLVMFAGIAKVLRPDGLACIYGPFNDAGHFTSASNAQFDAALRMQGAHMGIRDVEAVRDAALQQGLMPYAEHAMPANNRMLVWRRAHP